MTTDAMEEHNFHNDSPIIDTIDEIQKQDHLATKCGNGSLDDASIRIPLAVFYSLFFVLGLAGNLMALWVFLRLHSKKNSVSIFLINLALADLVLMSCLPFRVVYHVNHEHWRLHRVFCRIVGNVFYMNMYVSIILLGLISIDRYKVLQRRQRFLSCKHSILTCCILWVIATINIIPLIASGEERTPSSKCFQYKQLHDAKWKAYLNAIVVVVFWVIYGILVACYGKIAMGLLRVSEDRPDFPNVDKYKRTAQKAFFVLFLFTLCFVPYHVTRIFYIYSQVKDVSCQWVLIMNKTNELSLLLSAFNSCLDPVMYFVLCRSVRRTILRALRKNFCLKTCGSYNRSSYDKGRKQSEKAMHSETSTL